MDVFDAESKPGATPNGATPPDSRPGTTRSRRIRCCLEGRRANPGRRRGDLGRTSGPERPIGPAPRPARRGHLGLASHPRTRIDETDKRPSRRNGDRNRLEWTGGHFDVAPYLTDRAEIAPYYITALGALFAGDCRAVLPCIKDGVIDTVVADPPFNLGKAYGAGTDDRRPEGVYLDWCRRRLAECVRILKPGGSLFLYSLPRWGMHLGVYLATTLEMTFRHWIAVKQGACFPIAGRLHPSHYALLYFSKGQPNTFRRIRTPIETCRHCGRDVKDYGGHRGALDPRGTTLSDIWTDIPPVRHRKYKSKNRKANALSTKLLDRVVEMSTVEGDFVLDPFGGSGTTYAVCERKNRRWIGIEIDSAPQIVERLEGGEIHPHRNDDFVEG
jgi:site-specific DNA-methyltransferase (adenine-specific)